MNVTKVRLGDIAKSDLLAVVEVHKASFPTSALTRLGAEAARRYYEWQLIGQPEARFVGAWVENDLGGFCCCGCFRGALGGFLSRNRHFLAARLCTRPWLLFHEEVRTAAGTAFRRMWHETPRVEKSAQPSKTFGILSIAVSPKHRRFGLGAALMGEAERIASANGFTHLGLTVHPQNLSAIRFYEKLGWEPVIGSAGSGWNGQMKKQLSAK